MIAGISTMYTLAPDQRYSHVNNVHSGTYICSAEQALQGCDQRR